MTHLQQVNGLEHPSAEKRLLNGRLRVARQQRTEIAVTDQQYHRSVVDVALGQGARCIGLGWVEHLYRCPAVE